MLLNKILSKTIITLFITIFLSSCGKNHIIPGIIGPIFNVVNHNLRITMVLENSNTDNLSRINIPYFDNSFIEVGPALEVKNGTSLFIEISLKDIIIPYDSPLISRSLPGGRALPEVKEGKLPSIEVSSDEILNGENFYFYKNKKYFGVFIPLKIPSYLWGVILANTRITTFDLYIRGKVYGSVSIVGPDKLNINANTGIFILLHITSEVLKKIDNLIKQREPIFP